MLVVSPRPGQSHVRYRRGLFDFVGEISNKLFGTATEEEVDECRRQLDRLSGMDQRVTHAYNKLITLVNQSHEQLVEYRKHINALQQYSANMSKEIKYMEDILSKSTEEIHLVDSKIRLDQLLSACEASHNNWLRQINIIDNGPPSSGDG